MGFVRRMALLGSALFCIPGLGNAQERRPGEERPELKEFSPAEGLPSPLQLPPLAPPPQLGRTSSGQLIHVREFRVVGSTVFGPDAISAVTRPFENRDLGPDHLQEVRDQLTRLYIERGYVTSGAVILDQQVQDGVVEIQVIEGSLEELAVETSGWLRPSYVERRVRLGTSSPVNARAVEKRLQLLQEDPRIARIDAELLPGSSRGLSTLRVDVEEARPWHLGFEGSNERSPTVGSWGTRALVEHRDLTGNGDRLGFSSERSHGFGDWEARYGLPLTARDTWLEFSARHSSSRVVDEVFSPLDIEGDSTTYGLTLSHPLVREPGRELRVGLTGERRRSDTNYAYGPYPYTSGSDDGKIRLSVLRFFQEWSARGPERVVAARSTLNFGLDVRHATMDATPPVGVRSPRDPDARFFAWLGQLQIAQRLPGRLAGLQALLRADVQLASDPLLSLEQFALGGLRTVRGYRENALVRDNAWVASLELRAPLLVDSAGREWLELRPFADVGQAWDDGPNSGPRTLASLGAGVVLYPLQSVRLEAYWGGRLREIDDHGDDIQDNGWHFLGRVDY